MNNNNNKMCEDPNANKQRFKGVENFLRRVAFNLGNTPSQTEVKIISCIPIDVTDLQNKIINLERQLHEVHKNNSKAPSKVTPVHTALLGPTLKTTNTAPSRKYSDIKPLDGNTSPKESQYGDESSKQRKSTVSFVYPSWSNPLNLEQPPFTSNKDSDKTYNGEDVPEGSNEEHSKNFFKRAKKKLPLKKKQKPKTHLVYYAQAQSTPFNSYNLSTESTHDDLYFPRTYINEVLSKSYLANVVQRHYDPEHVVEEFSDTSHFTSPVCRDIDYGSHYPYESDMCSCCHGQFQNVDKYIGKNQNFIIEPMMAQYNEHNGNIFYDSNLYDIFPVKEKNPKLVKDDKPRKEHRRQVEMRCWPENARHKPQPVKPVNNTRKKPTTHQTKEHHQKGHTRKKSPKIIKQNKVDQNVGQTDTSNSCSVDCGQTYVKPILTHKTEKSQPVRRIYRQNPESLPIDVTNRELAITKSIQIDINSIENKTEETLNQIKSILQSVLQEVKTNPQINHVPGDKLKKDAVIQKGTSQSNIQACSTLLHSFTYNNSYNASPYIPTCSRQIPSHFCYPSVPYPRLKCTQNFPLLVQAPGHQMCSCYYKNSGQTNKPAQRQAATTATNTDTEVQESQGKETDKLIKEIYKSIALTLEFPKETSMSEYDDLKSSANNSTIRSEDKLIRKSPIVPTTELQQKDMQIEASMTPLSTTTVRSKLNENSGSSLSDRKVMEMITHLEDDTTTEPEVEYVEDARERANEIPRNETRAYIPPPAMRRVAEESSTEEEEEIDNLVHKTIEAKTEKKGLFQRMLGSVKLFNKGNKNKTKEATLKRNAENEVYEDESESDSDDYQTIYSGKSDIPKRSQKRHNNVRYAHTTYHPRNAQRGRKTPYMEQEFRRQWTENLTFQENRGRRYSSERPFSRPSDQPRPVYWQDYEARSAVIGHPVPLYQAVRDPNINLRNRVEQQTSAVMLPNSDGKDDTKVSKMSWLKKRKLGLGHCGEQWKRFILES